jgi:hypothetical protein
VSGPDPGPLASPSKRRQGFWLTLGEIVGVLALVLAGLNYWDSHKQHAEDEKRVQAQSQSAAAFVAVGEADAQGRTVALRPLKSAQAIQSQRYSFPKEVLDHPVDITAERPRIQADWVAAGLRRTLDAIHAKNVGSARVPVLIETTYVEDGDTRTDVSLYQLGFSWKKEFLSGRQIRLAGLALTKRNLGLDAEGQIEKRWVATKKDFADVVPTPPEV